MCSLLYYQSDAEKEANTVQYLPLIYSCGDRTPYQLNLA